MQARPGLWKKVWKLLAGWNWRKSILSDMQQLSIGKINKYNLLIISNLRIIHGVVLRIVQCFRGLLVFWLMICTILQQ